MEKGICFLDIDGVINTREIEYKDGKFRIFFYHESDKYINNKKALLWLNKLCIENNLDVYVISKWIDHLSEEELISTLYDNGLFKIVNIVGIGTKRRNESINEYLELNKEIKKFVILDDEAYYYKNDPILLEHLVTCSLDYGFAGATKYIEALEILKPKKILKK